jgi:hypothetical protein
VRKSNLNLKQIQTHHSNTAGTYICIRGESDLILKHSTRLDVLSKKALTHSLVDSAIVSPHTPQYLEVRTGGTGPAMGNG